MKQPRNVEGLKSHARQKRQEALAKAEKAISQLIEAGKPVNFNTVAKEGEVSKAWLYDEPQIRERIEQLRKQNSSKDSLPHEEKMSNQSKSAIFNSLQQRIKHLESEKHEMSQQLQVAYDRILETERIDSQRKELDRKNQQLRSEIDILKTEVAELTRKDAQNQPMREKSLTFGYQEQKVSTVITEEKFEEIEQQVKELQTDFKRLMQKVYGFDNFEEVKKKELSVRQIKSHLLHLIFHRAIFRG